MRKRVAIGLALAAALVAVAVGASVAAAAGGSALTHPGSSSSTGIAPGLPAPSGTSAATDSAQTTVSVSTTALVGGAYANTPNPKGQYDLSWTLPTAGKSGCLVCHGDPNLVRIRDGQIVSLTVDYNVLQGSAHKDAQCTGCHTDFAFKVPHESTTSTEWVAVAKTACKNCHPLAFQDYTSGAHSPMHPPGVRLSGSSAKGQPDPLCGDCHGGHSVPASGTPEAAAFQASAVQICGPCHPLETADYSDYYHGAAYKRGAPDAPACWNCHDKHAPLPSADYRSSTNAGNLASTCGGALAPNMRCHPNAGSAFLDYAQMIHGRQKIKDQNPLLSSFQRASGVIESALLSVTSRFGR